MTPNQYSAMAILNSLIRFISNIILAFTSMLSSVDSILFCNFVFWKYKFMKFLVQMNNHHADQTPQNVYIFPSRTWDDPKLSSIMKNKKAILFFSYIHGDFKCLVTWVTVTYCKPSEAQLNWQISKVLTSINKIYNMVHTVCYHFSKQCMGRVGAVDRMWTNVWRGGVHFSYKSMCGWLQFMLGPILWRGCMSVTSLSR